MCYDFENAELRFLLKAEAGHFFGTFDADPEAGLVAVALYPELGSVQALRIYDFEGTLKTGVSYRQDWFLEECWFRLLDGALLVAEKNKLRLYEIDVD